MQVSWEEIAAMATVLALFVTVAALIKGLIMEVRTLKRRIEDLEKQRQVCLGEFREINMLLTKIQVDSMRTRQQLEDYIRWQKNGKSKGGSNE